MTMNASIGHANCLVCFENGCVIGSSVAGAKPATWSREAGLTRTLGCDRIVCNHSRKPQFIVFVLCFRKQGLKDDRTGSQITSNSRFRRIGSYLMALSLNRIMSLIRDMSFTTSIIAVDTIPLLQSCLTAFMNTTSLAVELKGVALCRSETLEV
jgi:hypothetical protein